MICDWVAYVSWSQVDKEALMKRHQQGWLMEVTDSLDQCIERLRYNIWQVGIESGETVGRDPESGLLSIGLLNAWHLATDGHHT